MINFNYMNMEQQPALNNLDNGRKLEGVDIVELREQISKQKKFVLDLISSKNRETDNNKINAIEAAIKREERLLGSMEDRLKILIDEETKYANQIEEGGRIN